MQRGNSQVQICRPKYGFEGVEEEGSGLVVASPFRQLGMEDAFGVRPGRVVAMAEELTRVVETNFAGHIDGTGAELDRRDVAFAYGPQAHHETSLTGG